MSIFENFISYIHLVHRLKYKCCSSSHCQFTGRQNKKSAKSKTRITVYIFSILQKYDFQNFYKKITLLYYVHITSSKKSSISAALAYLNLLSVPQPFVFKRKLKRHGFITYTESALGGTYVAYVALMGGFSFSINTAVTVVLKLFKFFGLTF